MNRLSFSLIALLLFMSVVVANQYKQIEKIKEERNQYRQNTESLLSGIEELRKDSSYKAYQIQTLSINVNEYIKNRNKDAEIIKDLKIKLKQAYSVSKQELDIKVPVSTQIKDTVVLIHNVPDTIKSLSYKDEYVSFNGQIRMDSLTADISVPVTISQVVYKVPKRKFLWWSWGCKAIKQVIITNNPYVKLNYAEYIELKR